MFSLMRGSIPDAGNDPLDAITKAAALGAGEITFYSLFELSPTLDPAVLRELKAEADSLGIAIAASLDWLNPLRLDRHDRELRLGDGDLARGVRRLLETGASLGMREMFFTIGTLEDRAADWRAQLDAVAALLTDLRPVLAALGMRTLVKTHEEITSYDCLELVERVGPDALGISYDPANMLVRLEEPLVAARRLAPHVMQVHIDDATLSFEGDTDLRRHLAPVGDGAIDWPNLLALLPTAKPLIELHRGQFAIPAFDPEWLAGQPYIQLPEYAALIRSAHLRRHQIPIDQNDITLRLPAALELAGARQTATLATGGD